MPQIGRFPEHLSIAAILRMLRGMRASFTARFDEDLIEAFGLREFVGKAARTLSGGTRQKLSACLAFLPDPELLILDEPTAGLDPVAAEILIAKIRDARDAGKLVIVTSHVFSEFDGVATDILCLIDGRLQFHRRVDDLRAEHKGMRLGGIVAALMKETYRRTPPT
jgi:Cu-processing system ATP-binding protein